MNAETFWQAVAQRLDAGTPVFASLVVANTSGSPGTLGARLLLDADGVVEGTIGGGIMEAQLLEQARERLQQAANTPPELRRLVHRKDGTEHPSGLICAGEQSNVNLLLDPQRDREAVLRFSQAIQNQAACSATLTITPNGLQVDRGSESDAAPGMHLTEDNDAWCYQESSINPKRLAIIGGGHCGKALAHLALQIGYWVEVFDTRAGVLEGAEWSADVRRQTLADYGDLNDHLNHPALTTVVVMTAAVVHDIAALASVAATDLPWLGVMGSAAKIHEIRTQLAQRGIASDGIDAIHGPIGLPMKSDTPAEIAVSIMGQLLTEQVDTSKLQSQKRARRAGSG